MKIPRSVATSSAYLLKNACFASLWGVLFKHHLRLVLSLSQELTKGIGMFLWSHTNFLNWSKTCQTGQRMLDFRYLSCRTRSSSGSGRWYGSQVPSESVVKISTRSSLSISQQLLRRQVSLYTWIPGQCSMQLAHCLLVALMEVSS